MAATATITVPITATVADKPIHIGDLVLDVKLVNGRVKAPTAREIKAAMRGGLR